jgi:TPP-dependent pyruvate/acetoin dehydrogenase alpha subunit
LKKMAAEIFGKETGLSGGRGGHMHIIDADVNFACSGIVAQGMGPAVGAALSRKMQNKEGVAVSFIGEGAANQGAFHETLNLAAVWKLPVIFVVEDNAWGISVAKETATSITHNSDRAAGYGIPGVHVPGNDPDAIFSAAGEAIARAREGKGPTLLDLETYRLAGHFMGDAEAYRPEGEKDGLFSKDPIIVYEKRLLSSNELSEADNAAIKEKAKAEVDAAIAFARDSKFARPEEALNHVFA